MMRLIADNNQLRLIPSGSKRLSLHNQHEVVFDKTARGLSGIFSAVKFFAASTNVLIKGIQI
jgi:hypothetical protein